MSDSSDKPADAAEVSTTNPYTKYYNSQTLSDIVICYGDQGERVFYGHKMILSVQAQWFENAFTHGFAETGAEKITLREDNPAAVEGMFKHMYGKELVDLANSTSTEDMLFAIELYRVADKYDCPSLETKAPDLFERLVEKFVRSLDTQHGASGLDDLYNIASAVYDFEDSRGGAAKSPILKSFTSCIFGNKDTTPFNGSQKLLKLTEDLAAKIPEFGRDMFLELLQVRNKVAKLEGSMPVLTFAYKQTCPNCASTWSLDVFSGTDGNGHCLCCGTFRPDWKHHRM